MGSSLFRKTIDRFSYRMLLIVLISYIFIAGVIYFHLTKSDPEHGLSLPEGEEELTFRSALYFSVVTASSLGYGDFAPQGWSRLVAITEIIFGYIVFGLIVAKFAAGPDIRAVNVARLIHGKWIDRMNIVDTNETCYGLVIFSYDDTSDTVHYYGENLDRKGNTIHTFNGQLLAINWPTLIFKYENSASASPALNRGIEAITFEYSKKRGAYRYNAEGYDSTGSGHNFRGWKLPEEESNSLSQAKYRKATISRLISQYFPIS